LKPVAVDDFDLERVKEAFGAGVVDAVSLAAHAAKQVVPPVLICRGVLAVEDALVRGRLFETSSAIPVLRVPEEDILAVGIINPLADVVTQARVVARMSNPEPTPDRRKRHGRAMCHRHP